MLPWSTETTLIRPNLRQVTLIVLKWTALVAALGLILFFTLFGIDLNLHVTLREPFSAVRPDPGPLLSNCFKDYIPESNQQHYGIIPSIPLKDSLCFDFASLINPTQNVTTLYHTFATTSEFSDIELATLRSFIATQPYESSLYLWVTPHHHDDLKKWIHDDRIQLQVMNEQDLIQNTPLTNVKGDLIIEHELHKFAILYKFGGVWFDLDSLFIRNMSPLLSQEWLSQSSCFQESLSSSGKSSFLHFFKSSPYLCEIMMEADHQLKNTRTLNDIYSTVFHRLLKLKIQTWAVLPWCYTDPSQCLKSNSLPSAFDRTEFDSKKLNKVFAYHLHRPSWNHPTPGSIFKYLVNQHKQLVNW